MPLERVCVQKPRWVRLRRDERPIWRGSRVKRVANSRIVVAEVGVVGRLRPASIRAKERLAESDADRFALREREIVYVIVVQNDDLKDDAVLI